MFLLNSLYKYVAMNTSFRVSLLYLLLIIPQHGNSPLPVMESWLQKDQDDGFAQRDMTSSLTGGDESFGSAHQTYQNSLIRKKKADNAGNLPSGDYRKFAANRYMQPNPFFDGRYVNQDYSSSPLSYQKNNGAFGQYQNDANNKFRYKAISSRSPSFTDKFSSDKSALLKSRFLRESNQNLNPLNSEFESNPRWSQMMCKRVKENYAPNNVMGLSQSAEPREFLNMDENLPLEDGYSAVEDEQRGREGRNQEYRDAGNPENKSPQIFDENENEYYDLGGNPLAGEDNLNVGNDYNQILNEHAYMHKREGTKELMNVNKVGNSGAANTALDALRPSGTSRGFGEDSWPLEAVQEDMTGAKGDVANPYMTPEANSDRPDENLVWKLNSDMQSQELNDVLRNSQRALQEVQQLHQKMYKGQEGNDALKRESKSQPGLKYQRRNINFDEKRLKREDEDEQKNMKTGTDEGGGGEYEDEEGKGHKDEEEYYEDADLSDADDTGSEVRTTDVLSQKYVKRETAGDDTKNPEDDQTDSSDSQDYELNLENAPVENAEKSKKTSYREGEKTKKISVRKGVKIWDQWGKWSPCSVTCGVGRSTRWRHCIGGGCAQGEKEAQIKRCTNPAC